ncbi:MAG: hypothetical protein R3300_18130 [Candidatus Promineifilaceae bacterium]|nr:hypothetical protein [Candidatus Promineifilaceae bacterium]
MSEQIDEIKAEEKGKLEAAAREEERRPDWGGGWIVGVVLILVGLFFLLGELVPFSLDSNWWALFILIPALFNFGNAWRSYQRHGRLTASGRGSLIGGLIIATVGVIFLFDLSWGNVWPVFIIIIGFGALLDAATD